MAHQQFCFGMEKKNSEKKLGKGVLIQRKPIDFRRMISICRTIHRTGLGRKVEALRMLKADVSRRPYQKAGEWNGRKIKRIGFHQDLFT